MPNFTEIRFLKTKLISLGICVSIIVFAPLPKFEVIQQAQSAQAHQAPGARRIRIPAYPQRETDPEAVARGQLLYNTYACSFCHGVDTRGGNGGPSLLRSQIVQRDQRGETISPIIRNGVPETEMLAFNLSDQEIADIAEFLHSFELNSRDPGRNRPESIVVGNAAAGRAYFDATCSGCHSVSEDLQGIAARYDELDLQSNWLMPQNPSPTMVTVTTDNGVAVTGTLDRIDEFIVSLVTDDGSRSTFRRRGESPKVEVTEPLQPHKDLLEQYTDSDIHNVTAYLITLQD